MFGTRPADPPPEVRADGRAGASSPSIRCSALGPALQSGQGRRLRGGVPASPRVASTIPLRTSMGSASEVTVAAKPRPSLIMAGRPKRIWSLSMRSARSPGVIHDRHLDPLAVDELLLGRLKVSPEASDSLVDGLDGAVADFSLADGGTVGAVLDVRCRCAGTVGPALLRPAALARLDHHRRVGCDPVGAAQLTEGHRAGDELALERLVVADPVRGGRLRLSRPPAARRDEDRSDRLFESYASPSRSTTWAEAWWPGRWQPQRAASLTNASQKRAMRSTSLVCSAVCW